MDSLDAHANLLAIPTLVKNLLHQVATQIATLPNSPTHCPCKQTAKTYVKSHRLPLHKLLHAYKIVPSNFKDIRPIHTSPKQSPRYTTRISANRNAALEEIAKLTRKWGLLRWLMHRWKDRSSCCDVQARGGSTHTKEACRDEYHHTVYEAEVIGLTLAAELIARNTCQPPSLVQTIRQQSEP